MTRMSRSYVPHSLSPYPGDSLSSNLLLVGGLNLEIFVDFCLTSQETELTAQRISGLKVVEGQVFKKKKSIVGKMCLVFLYPFCLVKAYLGIHSPLVLLHDGFRGY